MEEEKSFSISKSSLYGVGIFLMLIVGGFLMLQGDSSKGITGNVIGSGEIQEVTIGMKDYNYYPSTINVKAGTKVKLSLDSLNLAILVYQRR